MDVSKIKKEKYWEKFDFLHKEKINYETRMRYIFLISHDNEKFSALFVSAKWTIFMLKDTKNTEKFFYRSEE